MLVLPYNPPHVLMPSEVELADAGAKYVGSWTKSKCVTCRGAGEFVSYLAESVTEVATYQCDCVEQLVLNRWMTVRGIHEEHQRLRWENMGGLPKHVSQWALNFVKTEMDYAVQRGHGFLLRGSSGSGKTALAVLILKSAMKHGFEGFMVSGQTIMEGLNGWKDAERYERFMHRLHHCDVLLYDHLGWEQGRDERISSAIERLLRDRIESGRSLFVTTNQDEHGLASKFGKEFSSQINGACVSHEWTIDKDWHNHSPLAEFEAKHHVIFPVVC